MIDIDEFWESLDELGEDEVRKRLAARVFGPRKLGLVREWLRRQQEIKEAKQKKPNYVDQFTGALRARKLTATFLLILLGVFGLAKVTGAIEQIEAFVCERFFECSPSAASVTDIDGETGWIFAGYFNTETGTFSEGPYIGVVSTKTRGLRELVLIGDTIVLTAKRKVIVVGYQSSGGDRKFESPTTVGVISENDETGVSLEKGTRLVVRDISQGAFPGNPQSALWLRVIDEPA